MPKEIAEVEVVAVGDELLSGATLDTNAARIARELEAVGVRVVRKTTVRDREDDITDAVRTALQRTGAVITTGGLGPTDDDVTRAAVARAFGRPLEFREELWTRLKRRYARIGPIPESNRKQAQVPKGGRVLANDRGTAPGIVLEERDRLAILLPGVPHEMAAMLAGSVVPLLGERARRAGRRPFRRVLRTASIAESAIAEKVSGRLHDLPLELAYLPEVEGVDLRLSCWERSEAAAAPVLDEGERRLRELMGSHIYAEGDRDLAEVVGDLLRDRGLTLVVAESCTAGLVAARLTDWPGASDFLWGGMIAYANRAKTDLLGVPEDVLAAHGAVSEVTARAMAEGACQRSGADASIAVTGIAGPTGGTPEKPVGTVWLAVRVDGQTVARRRHYPGARDVIRARAAQGALDLLRLKLFGAEGER